MVDIHCHILPEIDDGAVDIYDTLAMASLAVNSGVTAIVATPHCNIPGAPDNYFDDNLRKLIVKTRQTFADEGINLKLLSGMEVYVTYDLPDLIRQGKILTINQSRYLLVEFNFGEDPEFVEIMIERIKELKLIPVIAHPERYEFIKDNIDFARRLADSGCVLQANKGSFLGRYGASSQATSFELLKEGLVSVVASDAHNCTARTPYMTEAKHSIQSLCNTNALFSLNPRKICANKPI